MIRYEGSPFWKAWKVATMPHATTCPPIHSVGPRRYKIILLGIFQLLAIARLRMLGIYLQYDDPSRKELLADIVLILCDAHVVEEEVRECVCTLMRLSTGLLLFGWCTLTCFPCLDAMRKNPGSIRA